MTLNRVRRYKTGRWFDFNPKFVVLHSVGIDTAHLFGISKSYSSIDDISLF